MNSQVYQFYKPESSTPIAQRRLVLEGKIRKSKITLLHQRMPDWLAQNNARLDTDFHQAVTAYQQLQLCETMVYFAVSYAYADIPVGKTYDVIFPFNQPESAVRTPSVLVAVIHESAPLPMPIIYSGGRSICLFDFPSGIPLLIQKLRFVKIFIQTPLEEDVMLATTETFQYLLKERNTYKHVPEDGT